MEQVLLVMTNMPDAPSAQQLGRRLVESRLAACVNCLPGVHSVYRWQGTIEQADEVAVLIKTTSSHYDELAAAIKALHPYDVPEIIAIPVSAAWPAYAAWVVQETRKDVDV